MARTDGPKQVRVVKVDLDYRVYSDWRIQFVQELLEKYDGRIKADWHPEELMWVVTSTDPALPVVNSAVKTGPSSRTKLNPTTAPRDCSAPKRTKVL